MIVYTQGQAVTVIDTAPPPPPPPVSTITTKVLTAPLVCAPGYFGGGSAYDRFQLCQEIAGPGTLTARTQSNGSFGAAVPMALLCDGVQIATATTGATASSVPFVLTQAGFDALAEGWHWLSVQAVGWSSVDYPMYVRKGVTAAPQAWTPVCTSSYTLSQHPGVQHLAQVPAAFSPVTQPLPARTYPAFSTLPRRDQLVQTQLSVYRPEDGYRCAVTQTGVVTTANRQNYFDSDFAEVYPKWPLLDGPRGKGGVICPTSLRESQRVGGSKLYGTDPWRAFVVEADGAVRTLCGWRHPGMPSYWNGAQTLEFVGTWDASVPTAQRVPFHELWDLAWDANTLTTDPNAPPIGGEQPHIVGPTFYLTDTKNGRVVKAVFSPTDRSVPPTLTVPIQGLNEPWGAEVAGSVLYVTERAGNRLAAYDKASYALLWSVTITNASGLRYQDGFLYVGSLTNKAIWKVDVATRAVTLWKDLNPFVNLNSRFINLAISDGTFGPRGMVAMVSWSNNNYGYPYLFNPGEVSNWQFQGTARVGPDWVGGGDEQALSYPSAVSIGDGRMTWATVQEGLYRVSKALPADVALPATYANGKHEYIARGYNLTHGNRGFGLYGLPLPWGVHADMDTYLTVNGHS